MPRSSVFLILDLYHDNVNRVWWEHFRNERKFDRFFAELENCIKHEICSTPPPTVESKILVWLRYHWLINNYLVFLRKYIFTHTHKSKIPLQDYSKPNKTSPPSPSFPSRTRIHTIPALNTQNSLKITSSPPHTHTHTAHIFVIPLLWLISQTYWKSPFVSSHTQIQTSITAPNTSNSWISLSLSLFLSLHEWGWEYFLHFIRSIETYTPNTPNSLNITSHHPHSLTYTDPKFHWDKSHSQSARYWEM